MASLEQQLTYLSTKLKRLQETIPVDQQAVGLTLEPHKPGNGSTYMRLRAPKGKELPNGNRTMSLKAEDVPEWEQKIYARNQAAKVAQCFDLVKRAAEIAQGVTWDLAEESLLVKGEKNPTNEQPEKATSDAREQRPRKRIKYIFKSAKGASPINRTVHAIAEEKPELNRWYSPALCGEQPKTGSWGWDTAPDNELSCHKCVAKLKAIGIGR